jgi:hypothetical protein
MNISRNFMMIAVLYLLTGMVMGMYMGGSGDHTLAPVHAHINLLGFTLMTLFAVVYKLFPAMAGSGLAKVHFWLHQIGTVCLLLALFLMIGGFVAEATIGPFMPVFEGTVFLATICLAVNVYKNAL